MSDTCSHLNQIRDIGPASGGCEECLALGDTWIHLRQCLTCGHMGCCDASRNQHATRHFGDTGHPVIRSAERGERWMWCYVDEVGSDG